MSVNTAVFITGGLVLLWVLFALGWLCNSVQSLRQELKAALDELIEEADIDTLRIAASKWACQNPHHTEVPQVLKAIQATYDAACGRSPGQ